ncbi:MAG: hypothetical protein CM1200mP3_06690 [Chloroflexota bacterium]|nr:MAG: hypothetical protein CM1200mP3_06690 [Chloroflexota bacterium]
MPMMGFDWHLRDIPVGSEELAHDMEPFILTVLINLAQPGACSKVIFQ